MLNYDTRVTKMKTRACNSMHKGLNLWALFSQGANLGTCRNTMNKKMRSYLYNKDLQRKFSCYLGIHIYY